MDMKDITRCEYSIKRRLKLIIDDRASRHRRYIKTGLGRKLILWKETDRKQERVTFKLYLASFNWLSVLIDSGNRDPLNSFLSSDIHDCMGKIKRYGIIIKALHDIPLKAT